MDGHLSLGVLHTTQRVQMRSNYASKYAHSSPLCGGHVNRLSGTVREVQSEDKEKPHKAFTALRGFMRFYLAEAYRSRTYKRHHCRPLVLKTRRHTGDETLPQLKNLSCEVYLGKHKVMLFLCGAETVPVDFCLLAYDRWVRFFGGGR